MPGVGLEPRPGQDLEPAVGVRGRGRAVRGVEAHQVGPAGSVGDEVGGVHLGGQDLAAPGQGDLDPVVGLVAPTPGLPALAHDGGATGSVQVVRGGEVAVRGGLGDAAVLLRGEVEGEAVQLARVGEHLAVHAQAGHAAVRPDVEPDVGVAGPVRHLELVGGVAPERGAGYQVGPVGAVELLDGRVARYRGALDGGRLGVVAGEVRGVHDHAADHAAHAEPDDRPVVVLVGRVRLLGADAAPALALPAVHDLALVAEGVRAELGGLGDQQVLRVREGVLVGGDHAGAEQAGGQVDQLGERSTRGRNATHR